MIEFSGSHLVSLVALACLVSCTWRYTTLNRVLWREGDRYNIIYTYKGRSFTKVSQTHHIELSSEYCQETDQCVWQRKGKPTPFNNGWLIKVTHNEHAHQIIH